MDGVEVALPDGAQWMPGNGLGDGVWVMGLE